MNSRDREEKNTADTVNIGFWMAIEVIAHQYAYGFYPEKPTESHIINDINSPDNPGYLSRIVPLTNETGIVPIIITSNNPESYNIFITFRGTSTDSMARAMDSKGAGHHSFYIEVPNILSALLTEIKNQHLPLGKKIDLFLLGHSMGASDLENFFTSLLESIERNDKYSDKISTIYLLSCQRAGISKEASQKAEKLIRHLSFEKKLPKIIRYVLQVAGDYVPNTGISAIFTDPSIVETHFLKVYPSDKNFKEYNKRSFRDKYNPFNIRSHISQAHRSHKLSLHDYQGPLRFNYWSSTNEKDSNLINERLKKKYTFFQIIQNIISPFAPIVSIFSSPPTTVYPSIELTKQTFDALNILEQTARAATKPPFRLLQTSELYDSNSYNFTFIVKNAGNILEQDAKNDISNNTLTRIFNGDHSNKIEHLNIEIQTIIFKILDNGIFTDIDYISSIAYFFVAQERNFQMLDFYFNEQHQIKFEFNKVMVKFLLANNINLITVNAICHALEQLSQVSLELICNENNTLPNWLRDPDTLDLAFYFSTPEQQQKIMPGLLKAILLVITPITSTYHSENFPNLMFLIDIFIQNGIDPIKQNIVDEFLNIQKKHSNESESISYLFNIDQQYIGPKKSNTEIIEEIKLKLNSRIRNLNPTLMKHIIKTHYYFIAYEALDFKPEHPKDFVFPHNIFINLLTDCNERINQIDNFQWDEKYKYRVLKQVNNIFDFIDGVIKICFAEISENEAYSSLKNRVIYFTKKTNDILPNEYFWHSFKMNSIYLATTVASIVLGALVGTLIGGPAGTALGIAFSSEISGIVLGIVGGFGSGTAVATLISYYNDDNSKQILLPEQNLKHSSINFVKNFNISQ